MSEQKCPACSPDSPKCTLCKGTGVVRGTYQLGAWFDANDLRPCRAIMLNFPGGCGAILVCAGGTTTNELIGSVERMIELANPLAGVADPAAQVAKWRVIEAAARRVVEEESDSTWQGLKDALAAKGGE